MHLSPHGEGQLSELRTPPASTMRIVRGGLLALAGYALVVGVPALLVPRWFFTEFPLGRGWVAQLPPYNEHLVRDAGALFLGFGVLLAVAAAKPERLLVRAALVAWTVSAVPHLLFHLTHSAELEVADTVAEVTLLAAGVILPLVLLWMFRRTHR